MKTTSEFRLMLLAALCAAAASASAAPMTGVRIPTTKAGESAALAKYSNAGGLRAKRPAVVRPLIIFPLTPVLTAGAGGTLSFLPDGGSIATGGTVNFSNTASGGVVKTGAGTLDLGGNSAYTSGANVSLGTVNVLPSGGGSVVLTGVGTLVLNDPIPLSGGTVSSSGGSINITNGGTLTSNWWTSIGRNSGDFSSAVAVTPTVGGVSIEMPNGGVLNWANGTSVGDGAGGVLTLRDGTIIRSVGDRSFVVVIPEPGTGLFAVAGLAGCVLRRRRSA